MAWRAICDRCGFEYSSDQLRKDWQGLMVCRKDFEVRNPQDFVRGVPDKQTPPWTRPEPEPIFTNVSYVVPLSCTPTGSTAVADYAIADCAVADKTIESMQV